MVWKNFEVVGNRNVRVSSIKRKGALNCGFLLWNKCDLLTAAVACSILRREQQFDMRRCSAWRETIADLASCAFQLCAKSIVLSSHLRRCYDARPHWVLKLLCDVGSGHCAVHVHGNNIAGASLNSCPRTVWVQFRTDKTALRLDALLPLSLEQLCTGNQSDALLVRVLFFKEAANAHSAGISISQFNTAAFTAL